MPELHDGASVAMQGSAARPYILKNIGGVYSCSCPAWRNQSLPIERRTCKHLQKLRGAAAEAARIGAAQKGQQKVAKLKAPPLLLAETWSDDVDPAGWLMSEKLDGVRAYFDGKQFLSRQGNRYLAPDWFTAGLPLEPLDGELWIGRKSFQRTVGIVRRQDAADLWKEARFVIFDAPGEDGDLEQRLKLVELIMEINRPAYAVAHAHIVCRGKDHLEAEMDRIEKLGGEGIMLRRPGSRYETGRSSTLLKVKRFRDSEAQVVGHEPGKGRHQGRLGALLVRMTNGIRFAVGTGLSDAERAQPPAPGSVIRFRYQELSDSGVPRFPSYLGPREDS
jgi:DNA ligase-1